MGGWVSRSRAGARVKGNALLTTTSCPTAAVFAPPLSLPLSAIRSAVNPACVGPAVTRSGEEATLTEANLPSVRGRVAGASAITAASVAAVSSAGAGAEAARKTLEDTRSGDLSLSDPRSARLRFDSKPSVGADAGGAVKTATALTVRGMDGRGMKNEKYYDYDETVVGALEMSTGTDYTASLGKVGKKERTKSSAENERALMKTASVGGKLVAPTVGYMRKSLSEKMFRRVSFAWRGGAAKGGKTRLLRRRGRGGGACLCVRVYRFLVKRDWLEVTQTGRQAGCQSIAVLFPAL